MHGATFSEALTAFHSVLNDFQITDHQATHFKMDAGLQYCIDLLQAKKNEDAQVFLIGNGGSAAIVSHIRNDLVNKGSVRAHILHEPALLTCMSNDYGYNSAFANMLKHLARKNDLLICVSSSGKSQNMLSAVEQAKSIEMNSITLTGFSDDNPLRQFGDINIWTPSFDYGEVEVAHLFILHYLADALAKKND